MDVMHNFVYILMTICGATFLSAFKLVKNIIVNFLYAFSWQYMKSSMIWDMVGKTLSFCFLLMF